MNTKILISAAVCALATATATGQSDSITSNVLNEIVVTGSNSAVGRNLIPYTVSVVGNQALESTGPSQLLSVISGRVPSLFVTERGIMGFSTGSHGGSGHIKLRGVGGDRASAVLMMVDGQPQFAGIYSHHVADFYSKEYVEKVEVLRGPGSVLYGSNAMAGVINVITRDARSDGFHGSLSTQYGSYNTSQTTINATARYGRLSSLASVSYDRTDGNIKGLTFKQWSRYAKTAYKVNSNWTAAADLTLANFKADDPVYPKLDDPESTDIYSQSITRGEASVSATNRYGNTDGSIRAYYSWGNHYIDDPRHFHSTDDRIGVLAYQNFTPWHNASATVGFDFDSYSGEIPVSGGQNHEQAPLGTLPHSTITEYSPYVTLAQSFASDQAIISAGLRMSNSDKFDTQWVPQAGIVLSPRQLFTVKLSASMGYRNPSFRELYLYRMANPDLQPEKMWNFEASVGRRFSYWLEVDITAYYSRGSNIIQQVNMHNENTGRFINKGIEVSAVSHPVEFLTLSASYSLLHTSLNDLTGAPRNQYFISADWHVIKPLNISAEVKGAEGLFVDKRMDKQSYALLNLKGTYSITRQLDIFCRLENITDARYTINYGYPMPGFTAMGGFKIKL